MGNHYDSCRYADRMSDKSKRELSEEEKLEAKISEYKSALLEKKSTLKKYITSYPINVRRMDEEIDKMEITYKQLSEKYKKILKDKLKNI